VPPSRLPAAARRGGESGEKLLTGKSSGNFAFESKRRPVQVTPPRAVV
jgi:hypothetical protein